MKPQKSSLLLALATSLLNQALGCDKNVNHPATSGQPPHSLQHPSPKSSTFTRQNLESSNIQEEIDDIDLEPKDKSLKKTSQPVKKNVRRI